MPAISDYMTAQPWTISRHATLAEGHRLMREHGIRHLPVVDNGELVGILSMGDLHLLETFADLDPDEAEVDDAMIPQPFYVTRDSPVDEVAEAMAENKYSSAIVMDKGVVAGIFTYVDACRALAQLVRRYTAMDLPAVDLHHTGYSR